MPAASVEISDTNSIATEEKREPKEVFQDLQDVIKELDTKIKNDKLSAKPSAESDDPPPTLGELLGIKPK